MTREELIAQRAEVAQAERDHLLAAAEARGALKLLDLWLARMDAPATGNEAHDAGSDSE